MKVISHSRGVTQTELRAKREDEGQRGHQQRDKSQRKMKADLMKEAEAVIDELIKWHRETEKPNLREVEEIVLELRQKMSEQMAQVVIKEQETVRPVPGPVCQGCQQEMNYKGMKEKTVTSWVGAVPLERGYYYCDQCGTGLFPPG